MARLPAVAGSFYEGSPDALDRQVRSFLAAPAGETARPAVGIIAPHAGYVYCGKVAGEVYARVRIPDRVVVLAPNHTGLGLAASVAMDGPFVTPLGDVPLDADLAERLLARCPELSADDLAHVEEHAVEVQLPFLRTANPNVRITAICLRTMAYALCERIGQALAAAIKETGEPVLIVASSDMNHHEPKRVAERKDRMALERVMDLDARGLYGGVVEHHVSMCGFVPTVVMLVAAKALGARHGELVSYGSSGDVNHDESSVVGYAGVLVSSERPRHVIRSLDGTDTAAPSRAARFLDGLGD